MSDEKAGLRKKFLADIVSFPEEYIQKADAGCFGNITALPEFQNAGTVFAYCSVGREPDTLRIVEHMLGLGKTVALPLCEKGGIMHAHVIRSLSGLKPAMLGIPAPGGDSRRLDPNAPDLIIVPALAYDLRGFRLGYGGGYYDRYLPKTRAALIGLTRERTLVTRLPDEAHDVRVHCVLTEERVVRI